MQNEMRDRLIDLIKQSHCVDVWDYYNDDFIQPNPIETLADYFIKNGVVPVVRCKDCRYFITDVFKRTMCNRTFTMFEMNKNDYCSYGERNVENEQRGF